MGRFRVLSSVVVGLVFISVGFSRPEQQWTWFGCGAVLMLIGLVRWLRYRDRGVTPSDDTTTQL